MSAELKDNREFVSCSEWKDIVEFAKRYTKPSSISIGYFGVVNSVQWKIADNIYHVLAYDYACHSLYVNRINLKECPSNRLRWVTRKEAIQDLSERVPGGILIERVIVSMKTECWKKEEGVSNV